MGKVADDHRPPPGIFLRIFLETALALHGLAAGWYWWLSPKGFPIDYSRFWLNSVIPVVTVIVVTMAFAAIVKRRYRLVAVAAICLASAWTASAVTGRILFPESLSRVWTWGIVIAAVGVAGFILLNHRIDPVRIHFWLPWVAAATLFGVLVVYLQLPPPASTWPVNESQRAVPNATPITPLSSVSLVGGHCFIPNSAELTFKQGEMVICCRPLLTFDRISPDGFWSILSPIRRSNARAAISYESQAGLHTFAYNDGSIIRFQQRPSDGALELAAHVPVAVDTYSHLNSFCTFDISGHKELSLVFSPCPNDAIEVLPADYPTGRPARFAYLDHQDTFFVVEAASSEKGPFRTLASGPMRRGDQLGITLCDREIAVAFIVLRDWACQASTALSPTAGWGVPMNAIEFQSLGDSVTSPASIWITLAATSVGRGWESVGHRAGVYRNRLEIETANDGAP
jgi:hypothetical protein